MANESRRNGIFEVMIGVVVVARTCKENIAHHNPLWHYFYIHLNMMSLTLTRHNICNCGLIEDDSSIVITITIIIITMMMRPPIVATNEQTQITGFSCNITHSLNVVHRQQYEARVSDGWHFTECTREYGVVGLIVV